MLAMYLEHNVPILPYSMFCGSGHRDQPQFLLGGRIGLILSLTPELPPLIRAKVRRKLEDSEECIYLNQALYHR